jgi:hypothetical protein
MTRSHWPGHQHRAVSRFPSHGLTVGSFVQVSSGKPSWSYPLHCGFPLTE